MSGGPIKSWRDAHKPTVVSTKNADRICLVIVLEWRTACGRKPQRGRQTTNRDDMNCSECLAAIRADEAAAAKRRDL